jgi:hypothetical protein
LVLKKRKELQLTEDKMDVPKVFGISLPGKDIDADELERNLFVQKMVFMLELVVVPILRFYLTTMSLLDK